MKFQKIAAFHCSGNAPAITAVKFNAESIDELGQHRTKHV